MVASNLAAVIDQLAILHAYLANDKPHSLRGLGLPANGAQALQLLDAALGRLSTVMGYAGQPGSAVQLAADPEPAPQMPAETTGAGLHNQLLTGPVILFQQDRELRYTWLSSQQLHGMACGVIGKTDEELLAPEDAAQLTQLKRGVLAGGIGVCEMVRNIVDGQFRHFELLIEPLRGPGGTIDGLIGVSIDVTAQRRVEQERQRLLALTRQQQEELRQLKQDHALLRAATQRELARHLHDSLGAELTALGLDLTLALHEIDGAATSLSAARERLADALKLVETLTTKAEQIGDMLRPPFLEAGGLAAALRWRIGDFAGRVPCRVTFDAATDFPRLLPGVEYELYFIAQEALTNIAKHARADRVDVRLESGPDLVRLSIVDDGVGIDVQPIESELQGVHWGLVNMMERAGRIGGHMDIATRPGAGTRIVVEIPR